ncbi:MAG TPA: glutathione S-transferase family protein [Methyloceanibacter sp.]|nr:glutathione S-transferase family protein [Methyloceanibacter sp.]
MTIALYDMKDSPHARKVRLFAAELGIPLELIPRDPRKGETRAEDFLAKNPNGRVPTLVEGDFVLWESPAILKYLAAKHPERGLGGADAEQQALIDQWLFWWAGGAEAAMDALNWELFIKPKVLQQGGNDPSIMADAYRRIERFLPVLDAQLEGRDYVIGPLSIADFAIGARLDRGPTILKLDMTPHKNINAWLERLRAKSYWQSA